MTTWVKVFNSMPSHGKILMAGDRAAWLFICGLCYSNEHLTNGFIARHALPAVAPGVKNLEALAQRLVVAELWHEVEHGWTIHDYTDHQRSADEIRDRRAKDSARKGSGRSNGNPRGKVAESARNDGRNPRGNTAESSRARDRAPSQEVDVEVEEELRGSKGTLLSASEASGSDMENRDDRRLCRLLAEQAKERNPKFKVKSRERWLNDMRLLRTRDRNTPEDIERSIRWAFDDDFWGGVIQSPGNLRKHFPQIWDRMTHPHANVVPLRQSPSDLLRALRTNDDVIEGTVA